MECFNGFWVRRLDEEKASKSWYDDRIEYSDPISSEFLEIKENSEELYEYPTMDDYELMRIKAEKHSEFYRNLCVDSDFGREMSPEVQNEVPPEPKKLQPLENKARQRRTGVYELSNSCDCSIFKSVKQMREKYQDMLEETSKQLETKSNNLTRSISIEGFLVPPTSGYCSSGTSDDERDRNWKHMRVKRCGSSDSAVGQSDDEPTPNFFNARETVKDYPVSPYSPRGSVDHTNVPSKIIIEAQCVPYPVDRKLSDCVSDSGDCDKNDSRRQSCYTDDGDEQPRYRYWRTPSVVVSDYSDDIMGLTLEDIEYFRNQRAKECSSPDSSLHSSCSNLNYCGSTISCLDTDFIRHPFRKQSDCSTCSTLSGDETEEADVLPTNQKKVNYR